MVLQNNVVSLQISALSLPCVQSMLGMLCYYNASTKQDRKVTGSMVTEWSVFNHLYLMNILKRPIFSSKTIPCSLRTCNLLMRDFTLVNIIQHRQRITYWMWEVCICINWLNWKAGKTLFFWELCTFIIEMCHYIDNRDFDYTLFCLCVSPVSVNNSS